MLNRFIVDYDLSSNFDPLFVSRSLTDRSTQVTKLSPGDSLNLNVSREKFCLGYHIRDEYHDYEACPENSQIESGTQCNLCKRKDVLFPCMICDGSRCKELKNPAAKCDTTQTSVYIVSFGPNIKVGVSAKERLLKRWVEQGADLGIEVGHCPSGGIARQVESEISQALTIPKTARIETKISSVGKKIMSMEKLSELSKKAVDLVAKKYPDLETAESSPQDLTPYYSIKIGSQPFRREIGETIQIKGTFSGMKGPLFFFQDRLDYFLDFRMLKGRGFSMSDKINNTQLTLENF